MSGSLIIETGGGAAARDAVIRQSILEGAETTAVEGVGTGVAEGVAVTTTVGEAGVGAAAVTTGATISTGGIALIVLAVAGLAYALWPTHKLPKKDTFKPKLPEWPDAKVPTPPELVNSCSQPAEAPVNFSAEPESTPVPVPTAVPISSTVPAQEARKQGCTEERLNELKKEKEELQDAIPPFDPAAPTSRNEKRLAKVPCSRIKARLRALKALMKKRWDIQRECFGGQPDERHQKAIKELENAIKRTEDLEKINCAPGHPMAGL